MQGLRVQCMPNGQVATFLTNQDAHNDKHQVAYRGFVKYL